MSDFNFDNANARQRSMLEKVEKVYKSLQRDVVDYYWDRSPSDEDEARENEEGMRKYIKSAFEDLDDVLNEEDKDLGY